MQQMFNLYKGLDFDSAWPLLERAVQMGDGISKAEVRDAIKEGKFSFFSRKKSAAITAADGATLRIGLAGGDIDELLDIEEEITVYAMNNGFKQVEIMGRPGWERTLDGYEKVAILLRKEL
jgi:pyruvate/2-oxoacid:ferredoxin oxidoreductase beta subunit